MARGFRVECDEDGIKHVELESWARWMLGVLAALAASGIVASVTFAVGANRESGVTESRVANNERRITVIEATLASIAVNTAMTARDVDWIKNQWMKAQGENRP